MAFEPDPEFSPLQDGTRDVVKEDVYGILDEVPAAQIPEQDPPTVDVSPADIVRWIGGNLAMQIDAPCSGEQLVTWLLDTGEEVLLVGIQGGAEYEFCPDSAWPQQDFATALLGSVPTVQMVDGRFIVRGSVPQDMVADSPSAATTEQDAGLCSADEATDNAVVIGDAPFTVEAKAQRLLDAALACDSDLLIQSSPPRTRPRCRWGSPAPRRRSASRSLPPSPTPPWSSCSPAGRPRRSRILPTRSGDGSGADPTAVRRRVSSSRSTRRAPGPGSSRSSRAGAQSLRLPRVPGPP